MVKLTSSQRKSRASQAVNAGRMSGVEKAKIDTRADAVIKHRVRGKLGDRMTRAM